MDKPTYEELAAQLKEAQLTLRNTEKALEINRARCDAVSGKRDALAAQVENIRTVFKRGEFSAKGLAALEQAIDATPTQCLAQVKADAVSSINTDELFKLIKMSGGKDCAYQVKEWLDLQAERIKQGSKE
jgi:hypothetical protein